MRKLPWSYVLLVFRYCFRREFRSFLICFLKGIGFVSDAIEQCEASWSDYTSCKACSVLKTQSKYFQTQWTVHCFFVLTRKPSSFLKKYLCSLILNDHIKGMENMNLKLTVRDCQNNGVLCRNPPQNEKKNIWAFLSGIPTRIFLAKNHFLGRWKTLAKGNYLFSLFQLLVRVSFLRLEKVIRTLQLKR